MKTLAAAIYVLAAVEVFKTLYLGRKITMASQALTDLMKLVTDLTTAVTGVANELTALLTIIKNNNGVNPGAIETQVTAGENLVAQLNAAVAAAQAATNPPTPISVSVSPSTATVAPGGTQSFSASVSNDSANAGVTWSVATGGQGSVDTSGNYTAPAGAIPGTDTVVATSVTDPTKSGSAVVTIS